MKHQRPCICITLVEVVLWPKVLGNRVFILTSVFIAMSEKCFQYKCMCQRDFFVYHITGSTHSGIIFWVYFKDI